MTTTEVAFQDKTFAALAVIGEVAALSVVDAASHALMAEKVSDIREWEKQLEAAYKALPVIQEAKRLQAIKTDLADRLEQARKDGKKKQMAYEDAEEAKRKAEEARLAAIAKKEAEDAAIAAAAQAEKDGDKETAEAIVSAPVIVPTVVLPKTAPATKNRRKVTKFRILDAAKVNRQFLTPDEVKIGGVVRSLGKAAADLVGGIEVYEEFV